MKSSSRGGFLFLLSAGMMMFVVPAVHRLFRVVIFVVVVALFVVLLGSTRTVVDAQQVPAAAPPTRMTDDDGSSSCYILTMIPFSIQEKPSPFTDIKPEVWPAPFLAKHSFDVLMTIDMAMRHFNDRNGTVVPQLSRRQLGDCNVTFTEQRVIDSGFSKEFSIANILGYFMNNNNNNNNNNNKGGSSNFSSSAVTVEAAAKSGLPCGVVGPVERGVFSNLVPTTGALKIPHFSPFVPRYVRWSDSAIGMSISMEQYARSMLHYLERRKYLCVIYTGGPDSVESTDVIKTLAPEFGIHLETIRERSLIDTPAITASDPWGQAAQAAKLTGIRTIFINTKRPAPIFLYAQAFEKENMLTDDYVYVLRPEAVPGDRITTIFEGLEPGSPMRRLLSGALVFDHLDGFRSLQQQHPEMTTTTTSSDPFLESWRGLDPASAQRALSLFPPSAQVEFSADLENYFRSNLPVNYASFVYDSVIALGLGACREMKDRSSRSSNGEDSSESNGDQKPEDDKPPPPPPGGSSSNDSGARSNGDQQQQTSPENGDIRPPLPPPGTTGSSSNDGSKPDGDDKQQTAPGGSGDRPPPPPPGGDSSNGSGGPGGSGGDRPPPPPDGSSNDGSKPKGDDKEKTGSGSGGKPPPLPEPQKPGKVHPGREPVNPEKLSPLVRGIFETSFDGASGTVRFTEKGMLSREIDGLRVGLYNLRYRGDGMMDAADADHGRYEHKLVSLWSNATGWRDVQGEAISRRSGARGLLSITRVISEENFLPRWVRAVGLALMGAVWALAICGMVLLFWLRSNRVLKRSQPFFLRLICLGAFAMSVSIFTLSWDEGAPGWTWTNRQLNAACALTPWFFFVGNIIVFSSLSTKLWRLDKVLQFRRRRVHVRRSLWPLMVLLLATLAVLVAWTVVDPWRWHRIHVSALPSETYGTCKSDRIWAFFGPLMGLLLVAEATTIFFVWKTADIPEPLSDRMPVIFALITQIQAWAIGVPILALLDPTSTTAVYFGRVVLIWIFAVSPLVCVVYPSLYAAVQSLVNPDAPRHRVTISGINPRSSDFFPSTSAMLSGSQAFAGGPPPRRSVVAQRRNSPVRSPPPSTVTTASMSNNTASMSNPSSAHNTPSAEKPPPASTRPESSIVIEFESEATNPTPTTFQNAQGSEREGDTEIDRRLPTLGVCSETSSF